MLDPGHAKLRQQRLLAQMQALGLDAVVVGWAPHVHYFTTHQTHWLQQSAFVLWADGRSLVVAANEPPTGTAADDVNGYEANPMGTQRQEQPRVVAERVADALTSRPARRVGVDASLVTSQLPATSAFDFIPIDTTLWQLRRRKDPDELALMKTAIACTEAMYRRAREIIRPGVLELTVYSELHATAVGVAGEPLSAHLGNDYACGVPGGPPRNDRPARAGELYILDLGPAYRGYFADNSRAICVDGKPTDAQLKAWQTVTAVFPIVQRMARPGVRCRDVFDAVDAHYRTATGKTFPHHLGHGIGLQPHEFPHFNPNWDDTLIEGEVFTTEPGLYGQDLGGGMRIENQYLVGRDGVTNLTPFPMEL